MKADRAPRFVLREARRADLPSLLRLSRLLDSINLPIEKRDLERVVARSRRSFAGDLADPADGFYVFVAEDRRSRRVVGSALIVAKHGTPESPHYYLEMVNEERYSRTLQKMFRHTTLHLRHSMDGPTEVGGLIVEPRLRRHPERLGTQLSLVRFLYMAVHRDRFEDQVIAEMKPPLGPHGENRFWECYGARVTGLTFRDADQLSTKDKEFIPALFPDAPIYTCMLPLDVQAEIGRAGRDTVGAVRLLERIGLRFLNQVDPFDAGPYYGAPLDAVTVVRRALRTRLAAERPGALAGAEAYLIAVERPRFRAFRARANLRGERLHVSSRVLSGLSLRAGAAVAAVPLA